MSVSGTEDNHVKLRQLTVQHYNALGETFKTFSATGADEYLLGATKMNEDAVWGTDIELHTLACLMGVSIHTYTKVPWYRCTNGYYIIQRLLR